MIKGKQFQSWRSVGLAAQSVRIHQAREVDEIVLLDIGATSEGRGPDLKLVEELAEVLFCPLAVGGGVRTVEDARALLRAGADKVVVCSGGPKTVRAISDVAGNQCVVASVDYKLDGLCYTHSGTRQIPMSPTLWASELVHAGAGEILLTCIDREGTGLGYDLTTIAKLRDHQINVPVVAHGGCGSYDHMVQAIKAGASAVAVGSMFQFDDATPRRAAEYLANQGLEARL